MSAPARKHTPLRLIRGFRQTEYEILESRINDLTSLVLWMYVVKSIPISQIATDLELSDWRVRQLLQKPRY